MTDYLVLNYGEARHDMNQMEYACGELANLHGITEEEIFLFMIENKPISSMHTHSYGFNTANGRALKEQFNNYYYEKIYDLQCR